MFNIEYKKTQFLIPYSLKAIIAVAIISDILLLENLNNFIT